MFSLIAISVSLVLILTLPKEDIAFAPLFSNNTLVKLSSAKFETLTGEKSWKIPAWTIFTVKKISQKFFLANMKIENKEMEQSVEFIANVAGEVEFEVEEEKIETGHDDHNGHDSNNSHNGHGHGNSNNSGGGIAGNEGE